MSKLTQALYKLLHARYPKMEDEVIKTFVSSYLEYRYDFIQLYINHGSPLYVLDENRLRSNIRRFKGIFSRYLDQINIFFAMKSNNLMDISKIVVEEGMGLDVSSGRELEQALQVGANMIFFSGPGKTDEELKLAVESSDRVVILLDSFGELTRLNAIAKSYRRVIRVGVRLSTGPDGLWSRFGIPLSRLNEFFEHIQGLKFIKFEGLQFHNSWNLTSDAHVKSICSLGEVLKNFPPSWLRTIKFLDMGGGFWPEQGEWLCLGGTPLGRLKNILYPDQVPSMSHFCLKSLSLDGFAMHISDAICRYLPDSLRDCIICFEPGRWLCHEVMHLLLKVVDIKEHNIAITDAGTNAIGWERFEQDYFPVINLTHPSTTEHRYNIFGSLCTPHDVWGYSYHGKDICVGDLLLIPDQGAYTYSLRQEFIKPLPKVVKL